MRAPQRSPFVCFTVHYGIWFKNICPSERGGFGLEKDFDGYLQDRKSRVRRNVSVTVLKGITNRGKVHVSNTQFFQML
jgi:hypothetical protein